jgi:hypothetical protein
VGSETREIERNGNLEKKIKRGGRRAVARMNARGICLLGRAWHGMVRLSMAYCELHIACCIASARLLVPGGKEGRAEVRVDGEEFPVVSCVAIVEDRRIVVFTCRPRRRS